MAVLRLVGRAGTAIAPLLPVTGTTWAAPCTAPAQCGDPPERHTTASAAPTCFGTVPARASKGMQPGACSVPLCFAVAGRPP